MIPVLSAVEAALVEHFGHRPQRASVSFVGVEQIDVLRFRPATDERVYVSLGMSRNPMTDASEPVPGPDGPRAELLLGVRDPTDAHADVWRRLAVLAAAPAVEGVVYTPDMSVDLGEPLAAGSACTGVVVAETALAPIETPAGPVSVLRVVPATSSELAWCRVRGVAALRARWQTGDVDELDLLRRSADLR